MNSRNSWSKSETVALLDILRTSCIAYLDGTRSNRKGELYRHVENELRRRDATTTRDARQIENKWKNLKYGYEKYKQDVELGMTGSRPCEYLRELEDLFLAIANRHMMMNTTVETIGTVEDATYYDDGLVVEESQDLSVDEDTVVIEEIVYDSQDAIEFDETSEPTASTKAPPKRKKLTAENMDALLQKLCSMQRTHDDTFIRQQMELIENEFEAFREKEKEHWAQLKAELEELKEKVLGRIQKIARGDPPADATDEPLASEPKRRRMTVAPGKRK